MGIDYKSTIIPALDSHTNEINKSSVIKLEEMIALQQKLKDNSVMMEKKRNRVADLHSRVEEVSVSLVTPYILHTVVALLRMLFNDSLC